MDKITPNERWDLSRKYIVKSLYDNFDVFTGNKTMKGYSAIDKLIEVVAKDLNIKTEKVKYFLLADKIFEEHDIEREVRKKIAKAKAHIAKEKLAREKGKLDFERNQIQAEIDKREGKK